MRKIQVVMLSSAILLAGCATKAPNWVINPQSQSGIAATGCGPVNNNMSLAKSMAMALARKALAQQINTRVKAVDKLYEQSSGQVGVQTFTSASELITDEVLQNTQASRVEVIEIDGVDKLCVQVELQKNEVKSTFRSIVKGTQLNLSEQDEQTLYSAFSEF